MKTICFLSILFFSLFGFSQNRILIDGAYAVDLESSWKPGEIGSKTFYPVRPDAKINIGYNKDAAVWCRFTLKNPDSLSRETWLCFDNNHIDSIVLYDSPVPRMLGDRTSYVSPYLDAQAFEINLAPQEQKMFYAKVKKGISFFDFSYQLREAEDLARESRIKIALVSFFLGIIFVLVLFNSILFYISRLKMYLYYIVYSVLSAFYIGITSYYAKFFLFQNFVYFSELRIYIASLWLISLTVFLSHYMDVRGTQPRKYKAILMLNLLNLLNILITIVLLACGSYDGLKVFFMLGYLNFAVIIMLILWAAVANFKTSRNTSVYILLAFVPQSIWGLGIILKSFGIIPKNMHEDALVVICLYEVFLFGYVLAKNYIDTFRKNNSLMREIIWEKENTLQAITQAQVRERRNIANIIHDNLGSKIAYISQLLQLRNLMLANQNINELAEAIREISHQILPKSLDEGALVSSIKSQIDTWNNSLAACKIELFSFDFPEKIDEVWIYDLYLISTEIINNSIKHGQAASIHIELYNYPDSYLFQFTDDGKGFDTTTTKKGFGLENIEKRIDHYNGVFEINSARNEGTVIQITLYKTTTGQ